MYKMFKADRGMEIVIMDNLDEFIDFLLDETETEYKEPLREDEDDDFIENEDDEDFDDEEDEEDVREEDD